MTSISLYSESTLTIIIASNVREKEDLTETFYAYQFLFTYTSNVNLAELINLGYYKEACELE